MALELLNPRLSFQVTASVAEEYLKVHWNRYVYYFARTIWDFISFILRVSPLHLEAHGQYGFWSRRDMTSSLVHVILCLQKL